MIGIDYESEGNYTMAMINLTSPEYNEHTDRVNCRFIDHEKATECMMASGGRAIAALMLFAFCGIYAVTHTRTYIPGIIAVTTLGLFVVAAVIAVGDWFEQGETLRALKNAGDEKSATDNSKPKNLAKKFTTGVQTETELVKLVDGVKYMKDSRPQYLAAVDHTVRAKIAVYDTFSQYATDFANSYTILPGCELYLGSISARRTLNALGTIYEMNIYSVDTHGTARIARMCSLTITDEEKITWWGLVD